MVNRMSSKRLPSLKCQERNSPELKAVDGSSIWYCENARSSA